MLVHLIMHAEPFQGRGAGGKEVGMALGDRKFSREQRRDRGEIAVVCFSSGMIYL